MRHSVVQFSFGLMQHRRQRTFNFNDNTTETSWIIGPEKQRLKRWSWCLHNISFFFKFFLLYFQMSVLFFSRQRRLSKIENTNNSLHFFFRKVIGFKFFSLWRWKFKSSKQQNWKRRSQPSFIIVMRSARDSHANDSLMLPHCFSLRFISCEFNDPLGGWFAKLRSSNHSRSFGEERFKMKSNFCQNVCCKRREMLNQHSWQKSFLGKGQWHLHFGLWIVAHFVRCEEWKSKYKTHRISIAKLPIH